MMDDGCSAGLMEVSSIGIAMHRADAIPFRVAIFTNFSRDHLDFHASLDEYRDAKADLFRRLMAPDGIAIINSDDPARETMTPTDRETWTYGLGAGARVRGVSLQPTVHGTQFQILTPTGEHSLFLPLLGQHNVTNALAAFAAGIALGISADECIAGLENLSTVPGRLEPVKNDAGLTVLVDYAHTPDALKAVLTSRASAAVVSDSLRLVAIGTPASDPRWGRRIRWVGLGLRRPTIKARDLWPSSRPSPRASMAHTPSSLIAVEPSPSPSVPRSRATSS